MRMYDVIEKKRDKKELSDAEIKFFVDGYIQKSIPDYQAAALLMAIFLNGMNERETATLTKVMADSGEVMDLSQIEGIKVDKHSTGGVGDKTTLILAPIVAAAGAPVAKMSGKGLGHTGGTIDKLLSIPGFRTDLSKEEFIRSVQNIGIAVVGQTGNLAPADKLLYALRDVTATINNRSLIASSIMSKKIAAGADRIVLDVKTGSGAFMKHLEEAFDLAEAMVQIAHSVGRKATAVITDMDIPLGNGIGNAIEVIESIETLKGRGPADLREVSFVLAAKMIELALDKSEKEALEIVHRTVDSGKALKKLSEMIQNQGGDARVIEDYSLFGQAEFSEDVLSDQDGFIVHMKTDSIGKASVMLGAGRETIESVIDYNAGIYLMKKPGDKVTKGEVIAKLYSNQKERFMDASKVLQDAMTFSKEKIAPKPLILGMVDMKGFIRF